MSTTDTRAAFEAWMREEYGADDDMLKRPYEDRYFWPRAADAWAGWQAATEAAKATGTAEEQQTAPEPCPDPAACNAQGCRNPAGRCEEAAFSGEPEAHKLARILWNMVEAVEDYKPSQIYRDGYQSADGDVFVHRAGNLLVEQQGEIEELRRYVDSFGSQLAELKSEAARQPAPVAIKTWQERMKTTKLTWKTGDGKLIAEYQLMTEEIAELRAALAATAAPVLTNQQRAQINFAAEVLFSRGYTIDCENLREILAATRSQP